MNTLEKIGGLTASDLFLNNTAESRIEAVRTEALALVFDVTTAKGREECISHAAKVTKTKTSIEKLGKALVDPIKKEAKVIENERKMYRDELEAIKAEVRKPVTLWEEAQAAAKAKIDQHFFELEQAGISTSPVTGELLPLTSLEKKLQHLTIIELDVFGDRSEEAEVLISAGATRINAAIQQRKDADELAELRKAKADQEAADEKAANEKRIAEDAIAKHEAAKAAEGEELAAKTLSKMDRPSGEQSKQDRLREVNSNLLAEFIRVGGVNETSARLIITAIAKNQIDNIQINY